MNKSQLTNIAEVLSEENINLSQQNAYLLEKLRVMKQREEKLKKKNARLMEYKKNYCKMQDAYYCMS